MVGKKDERRLDTSDFVIVSQSRMFTDCHSVIDFQALLEMAALDEGCAALRGTSGTWMRHRRDAQSMKCFLLLVFPLLSFPRLIPHFLLSTFLPNTQHHLIQTLCLHMSRSPPLHRTLIADHYLRIDYFVNPAHRGPCNSRISEIGYISEQTTKVQSRARGVWPLRGYFASQLNI